MYVVISSLFTRAPYHHRGIRITEEKEPEIIMQTASDDK